MTKYLHDGRSATMVAQRPMVAQRLMVATQPKVLCEPKALCQPLGLCTILPRVALDSSGALPLAQVNQEPVTHSPHVRLWRQNEHIYTEQGLDTCRGELQSITHVKTKRTQEKNIRQILKANIDTFQTEVPRKTTLKKSLQNQNHSGNRGFF